MNRDARSLARSLASAIAVDEYIVSEVNTTTAAESLDGLKRMGNLHRLEAQLFVDRKRGRGSARFSATPESPLAAQIQEASTRAFGALGPLWSLQPPSAPSRVLVRDSRDPTSPALVASEMLSEFSRSLGRAMRAISATATVEFSANRAIVSSGFDGQFPSANLWLDALVQVEAGAPVPLRVRVRRLENLDLVLEEAVERARRQSLLAPRAAPTPTGVVDLAIELTAYLPQHAGDYGIWTPIAQQAEADLVRAGISLHPPGQPLLGSVARGDALTLASVGTEDYALRCAPFSFDGQAVRNFSLAENGRAVGVSVGHRASSLGAGPANGGVRRLEIEGGSMSAEELGRPASRPLLLVHTLDSLRITPAGHVLLEVGSAEMRTRDALGRPTSSDVRGGIISGSLPSWISEMYLSRERLDASWVRGPQRIRINNLRVH